MRAIVRKKQQRKLLEPSKRELDFAVRGSIVETEKIDRWMKRHNIPESKIYPASPNACKEVTIFCFTVNMP